MLGRPEIRSEPLRVGVMAAALVVAAFTGAAAGMLWQKADFGGSSAQPDAEETPAAEQKPATP